MMPSGESVSLACKLKVTSVLDQPPKPENVVCGAVVSGAPMVASNASPAESTQKATPSKRYLHAPVVSAASFSCGLDV